MQILKNITFFIPKQHCNVRSNIILISLLTKIIILKLLCCLKFKLIISAEKKGEM